MARVDLIPGSERSGDDPTAEVLRLRCELGRAGQTIRQREEALAVLNRRLLAFEREQWRRGHVEPERAVVVSAAELEARRARHDAMVAELAAAHQQLAAATAELAATAAELARLRATKLFRVAAPARRIYARLRRL